MYYVDDKKRVFPCFYEYLLKSHFSLVNLWICSLCWSWKYFFRGKYKIFRDQTQDIKTTNDNNAIYQFLFDSNR